MGTAAVWMRNVAPQFVVPDVVRAAEYYRDVLGFPRVSYAGDPPVFAMVGRDGVEIHFGRGNAPRPGNATVWPAGADAYVRVLGVNALAAELRSRGATIVAGPVVRVYGMREVVVEDCHGFRLVFGEDARDAGA